MDLRVPFLSLITPSPRIELYKHLLGTDFVPGSVPRSREERYLRHKAVQALKASSASALPAPSLNLAWSPSCHAGGLPPPKDSRCPENQLERGAWPRASGHQSGKKGSRQAGSGCVLTSRPPGARDGLEDLPVLQPLRPPPYPPPAPAHTHTHTHTHPLRGEAGGGEARRPKTVTASPFFIECFKEKSNFKRQLPKQPRRLVGGKNWRRVSASW